MWEFRVLRLFGEFPPLDDGDGNVATTGRDDVEDVNIAIVGVGGNTELCEEILTLTICFLELELTDFVFNIFLFLFA